MIYNDTVIILLLIALGLVLLTFLFLVCKMIRMGNTETKIYENGLEDQWIDEMVKDTIEKMKLYDGIDDELKKRKENYEKEDLY